MNTDPASARSPLPPIRHFFVDEAGDTVVFGKRGKILVGTEGCSKFFLLGMVQIEDPPDAFRRIEELRAELLADPYFKGVPSMQPAGRKTAICFHAKNDLPEVRREVFRLLPQLRVKVRVAMWQKHAFAVALRLHSKMGRHLGFNGNDIYDNLVKELFHNQLHEAETNMITFARRGKSARIESLAKAIAQAKTVFRKHHGGSDDRPCNVLAAYPSDCVGLQVIDYYLWAYQRWVERAEDRFYRLVEQQFAPVRWDPDTAEKPDAAIEELRRIPVREEPKRERPSSELGSDF